MELAGMLTSEWRISETNRRAKFYKLTAAGRKHLGVQSTNWNRLVLAIARVMEG
jgi:PadR family transcriptional regulator PadR